MLAGPPALKLGPFGGMGELLLVEMEICAGATGGENKLLPAFMLPPLLKPPMLDVLEFPSVWVGSWLLNAPTIRNHQKQHKTPKRVMQ